jgi:hypothetical protein
MTNYILGLAIYISQNVVAQVTSTAEKSTNHELVKAAIQNQEQKRLDSIECAAFFALINATLEEMLSKMTEEEISYFKENFMHTRGNFTIPEKPIQFKGYQEEAIEEKEETP